MDVTEVQTRITREISKTLNSWVEGFPTHELREAIEELEAKRRDLDEHIAFLREALESFGEIAALGRNGNGHKYPTKRRAVLDFLTERSGEEFRLAEIREQLVARTWLPDTDKAAHALQMMLSNLTREGAVERVRIGVYRLAPRAGAQILTLKDAQGKGGDA